MKKTLPDYPNLQQQRQQLLQQLSGLEELRRGSLTEQFLMVKRKDGSRVKRGPYPLLTRKHGRKTVSLRLTDPALVPLYRQQIQALRQFETVVDRLVLVGEQLSDLAVAEVVQKKTPWWNWNKPPRCVGSPPLWQPGRRLILKLGRAWCCKPPAKEERAYWGLCCVTGSNTLPGR
jgi:hypothetical protein